MSLLWRYERLHVLYKRTAMLIGFFFILVLILIARLFYLQIIEGERYLELADKNRTAVRLTLPARGYIYDRNGVKLAENRKTFQAVLIREQAPDYLRTLENFQKLMSLSEEEVARIKKEIKQKRPFMPIRIKDNLTFQEAALIQMNAPDLMGIQTEEEIMRVYPLGEYGAHVVGYVSLLTDRDMEKNPDSPLLDLPGYRIGRVGIEEAQESVLQGIPGMRKTEINVLGRTVRLLEEEKAVKGKNMALTIDARLQKEATKAMGEEAGAAIVVDVQTGDVLALVSTPSFDANLFTVPISTKTWNALIKNEKNPLQNKAVNGQYSPGSIFKLVVALAGLESGHITPERKVYCSGRVQIGKQYFHCWKRGGHGHLTLEEALMHSCDVYFYQLAQEIGPDKIAEVARRLGFGELTGIGITGEKKGLVPTREWKLKRYDDGWRLGDTLNYSIGQGYLTATPIQLARAVAEIANGGYPLEMHLITSPDESRTDKINRIKAQKRLFQTSHLRLVRSGMNMVVNQRRGTAYYSRIDVDGQKMAGKTASTQVRRITMKERKAGIVSQKDLPWKYRDHGLFAAFAPIEKPRFAVVVVAEHGGGGASAAAPIAARIMREALRLYPNDESLNNLFNPDIYPFSDDNLNDSDKADFKEKTADLQDTPVNASDTFRTSQNDATADTQKINEAEQ